jgi:N-methylhydantoinase B
MSTQLRPSDPNPIYLEVFKHIFSSIADEMGSVLRKSSFSPNIKERRDFSCAIFDSTGDLIAEAAHIPVHLGSMPLSVMSAINAFSSPLNPLMPGDMVMLNDPFLGGTHLPDITLVAPVFIDNNTSYPYGYVATRAHHADVGGMTPGSMPISREIYQEGLIIPPIKFVHCDQVDDTLMRLLIANVRTPQERKGDFLAQIAANRRGVTRLKDIVNRFGMAGVTQYMTYLIDYTERMTRQMLTGIQNGAYTYTDYLDGDGVTQSPIPITVTVTIDNDQAIVDFTGSAPQQAGGLNAVYAITMSAVHYVFRCLLGIDAPNNSGCLKPIHIIAPERTIVNAQHPAAVAGGNVETSQRIVDVLMGALFQACPDRIPAASQGTMNNLTIGGWDEGRLRYFTYYETIGGGTGARLGGNGISAIHSHMTNTLNTPIEAIEYAYPLRVTHYGIRRGSGGKGQWKGGDGIRRDIQVLDDVQATILSDRRITTPYGLANGGNGLPGKNVLIRDGEEMDLGSKGIYTLKAGDVLRLYTPGGGGYGAEESS